MLLILPLSDWIAVPLSGPEPDDFTTFFYPCRKLLDLIGNDSHPNISLAVFAPSFPGRNYLGYDVIYASFVSQYDTRMSK